MTTPRPTVRIDTGPIGEARPVLPRGSSDQPFRILVLGDLSGRASRGVCEPADIASRRCHALDRDNFDDVLGKLAPELAVPLGVSGGIVARVSFSELDDFHPDALYPRVGLFDRLRDLRARLVNPATAAAAIAELAGPSERPPSEPAAPPSGAAGDGSLLDLAMQATDSHGAYTGSGSPLIDDLIRELVTPHLMPRPDPRQEDLVAGVDRAITEQMRALLRAPRFQALESAWRGLDLLVRRIETDRSLRIDVLDVSQDELRADLRVGADPLRSGIAAHLVERTIDTPGGEPFAVVVGAYSFGATQDDAELLGALATIAARAGAAFIAAGEPGLVGCPGFDRSTDPADWEASLGEVEEPWNALRARPEAASIGLVMPRFLLRMPYGARTSPTTCFTFEEEGSPPRHDELLWGNSALLVAWMLAEAWRRSGWQMRPGQIDRIDGLPVHVRTIDGEVEAIPCAEFMMTSRTAECIGDRGLMPLFSVRGSDAVQLGTVRSLSATSPALAGRWTG